MAKTAGRNQTAAVPEERRAAFGSGGSRQVARAQGGFESIEHSILPKILAKAEPPASIRAWVAGCGTGEDAYRLALLLLEQAGPRAGDLSIQVFGTDRSGEAIRHARAGIYPAEALAGISPERKQRYFSEVEGGFQVTPRLRGTCAFGCHDLAKDPPFPNLDLIHCKDLPDGIPPAVEKELFGKLYYALKPDRYLVLGWGGLPDDSSKLFLPDESERNVFVRQTPATSFGWQCPVANRDVMVPAGIEDRSTELRCLADGLSDLLQGMDIPIVTLDSELRVRRFTPAAGVALHLTAGDIGRSISGIAATLDIPECGELASAAIRQFVPMEREVRHRGDGLWYTLRVRPYKSGENRVEALMALLDFDRVRRSLDETRDAYRRVEQAAQATEEALRQSEERFRALVTATSDVVYRVSADWNELRYIGGRDLIPDAGNPSRTWLQEYVHPDDRPRAIPVVRAAIRAGSTFELEHRILHPDGSQGWVFSRAVPIRNAQGEIIEWFGASTDITHRKEAETALRESEAHLQALTASLFTAQEDERKRIAHELHDDFNQRMAMLCNDLTTLEERLSADSSSRLGSALTCLRTQVNALSDDVRRAAYRLHPPALDHFGLVAALEALCNDFSKTYPANLEFTHRKVAPGLRGDAAVCVYRVAQECLNNIGRHSSATQAKVNLEKRRDAIQLSICDNGNGYRPDLRMEGLGLIGIRERVRALGGTVAIDPGPGRGTRVEVQIPLAEPRE